MLLSVVADYLHHKNAVMLILQSLEHTSFQEIHQLVVRPENLSAQSILFDMKPRPSQGTDKLYYRGFEILAQRIHGYVNGYVHLCLFYGINGSSLPEQSR